MAFEIIKSIKNRIKNWWIPLIVGIIFILTGIYTLLNPDVSYITLSLIFSISFLFSGISEIIFSISNRKEMDNWGWVLAYGILSTVIGGVLINHPLISLEVFSIYVSFLILFRAMSGISFSFELKELGVDSWWISLLISVILLFFAITAMIFPGLAGLTAVYWVGMGVILAGIITINYSIQLKKIKDLPDRISEDLKNKYENFRKEINNQFKNS